MFSGDTPVSASGHRRLSISAETHHRNLASKAFLAALGIVPRGGFPITGQLRQPEVSAQTARPASPRRRRATTAPHLPPSDETAWWAAWWYDDYSWDGLAYHEWQGWRRDPNRESLEVKPEGDAPADWPKASLQDYWRRAGVTEADLVTCGDDRFTCFHLPYTDQSGAPTDKTDWNYEKWAPLKERLADLLAAAKLVRGRYGKIEGPDERAQFDGVVLPFAPPFKNIENPSPASNGIPSSVGPDPKPDLVQPMSISARRAHLRLQDGWMNAPISELADFGTAFFSGETDLRFLKGSGTIYFPGAIFGGGLNLHGARLDGGASFTDIVIEGGATFSSANFGRDARFDGAVIKKSVHFVETTFNGYADFKRAQFFGDVAFRGAVFKDIADFKSATLGGIGEHASTISFIQADFQRFTTFDEARFTGDIFFSEAKFSARTEISKIRFVQVRRLSFESAVFNGPLAFSGKLSASQGSVLDRAFLDVELPSLVDCTGTLSFDLFSVFDGALSKGRIDLAADTLREDKGFRVALARAYGLPALPYVAIFAPRLRRRGLVKALKTVLRTRRESASVVVTRRRDARLRALEGGCRTIKLAAETTRDRLSEQRFYRYELIARRDNTQTPSWERGLSRIFGRVADYGASIARPLAWLAWLWPASAAIYWFGAAMANGRLSELLTYEKGEKLDSSVAEALLLSGEALFRPFFVWAPRGDEVGTVAATILDTHGPALGVAFRLFATAQSFAAVILLFLSALAVRRRFQIN